jgi:hypothetical protein
MIVLTRNRRYTQLLIDLQPSQWLAGYLNPQKPGVMSALQQDGKSSQCRVLEMPEMLETVTDLR